MRRLREWTYSMRMIGIFLTNIDSYYCWARKEEF
jgi:hypothetical protein